ncbi:MAG: undecaprenyl-diphosphate phosphatase [Candidatus Bilamarchaeaceae archaeon]
MDLAGMLLLSFLQGVTEWLPISSSAHLALAQYYFMGEVPIVYDVGLHFGTMLAALLYFRERISKIIFALLKFQTKSREFNLAAMLLLASIPTAIIGFSIRKFFASMYLNPFLIGLALVITAAVLLSTLFVKPKGAKPCPKNAIAIGIAQGIAIAPGISRSGSTIAMALHAGMEWKEAAAFSFLLAIPAIVGATFFELNDAPIGSIDPAIFLIGICGASLSGYAAIYFLMNKIDENTFPLFAAYCLALGIFVMGMNPQG